MLNAIFYKWLLEDRLTGALHCASAVNELIIKDAIIKRVNIFFILIGFLPLPNNFFETYLETARLRNFKSRSNLDSLFT